jgi:hypothetical protein
VNAKLLAVVMISGLVLSGSSVYLSNMAFAEDPWSQIAQRQPIAQQNAAVTYSAKYQYNDLNESQRNWSGLTFTTTSGTYSPTRNLEEAANASLNNALAEFNTAHGKQLTTEATNYTGLNSTTTGENGRDRNTLIAEARAQVLNASESLVPQSWQRSADYTNLNSSATTNETAGYNQQTQIEKTWNSMATELSPLVGNVTKQDPAYQNLQVNATTTGYNLGSRDLPAEQAASLASAMQVFQDSHATNLPATQSTQYAGLNSTTTNEQNAYDRNVVIANERMASLQNALNFYSEYYQGKDLNQTTYSH